MNRDNNPFNASNQKLYSSHALNHALSCTVVLYSSFSVAPLLNLLLVPAFLSTPFNGSLLSSSCILPPPCTHIPATTS